MQPRIPLPDPFGRRPFTSKEAMAARIGRKRLRGRDIVRPFRGVNVPQTMPKSVRARCEALAKRIPSTAFFCGPTAALLHGMPLPRRLETAAEIHVAVPAPATAPVGRGIAGHSFVVTSGEILTISALRTSSVDRTWCELAPHLSIADLVVVGDFLIHWRYPLATRESLAAMVDAFPGRRWKRKLRAALTRLDDRSESPQESRVRIILVDAGFEGLEINYPITTTGGFRYRADFAFPAVKVIIEYQGAYHETPTSFRADMTRISRLEADGWYVIQINGDDLDNPGELVARIARVLAARVA